MSLVLRKRYSKLARIFIAEILGTAFLLIIGCFGCVDNYLNFQPTHATISLCAGLALMIGINSFAAVSGAHFNPSLTLAALILGMIDFVETAVYVIAQLIGAVFGYSIVRFIIPSTYLASPDDFCLNLPQLDNGKAIFIEFIITFILICVICAVWDPVNANHQDSAPLRIGLTVSALVYIAGNFSGASMNPARSFGPALYNLNWQNHWIYWIGPLFGSFVAAILFREVLMESKAKKGTENEPIEEHEELERLGRSK